MRLISGVPSTSQATRPASTLIRIRPMHLRQSQVSGLRAPALDDSVSLRTIRRLPAPETLGASLASSTDPAFRASDLNYGPQGGSA
jgi:hypothetical protein